MPRERRIPENTADYARWLADQIEERSGRTPMRLNPDTVMFVGMALRGYAKALDAEEAGRMNFTIADSAGMQTELLAACNAPEVAWAAYHLAIASRPRRRIVLRHCNRIIGEHAGEEQSTAPIEARMRPD